MNDASNHHTHTGRDSFGSSFGILVALAGSAVGLGNLWRFPYLVGENGGAAFILIYLAFVFLIGMPIMLSEFVVGRRSQSSARGAGGRRQRSVRCAGNGQRTEGLRRLK